ncbi:MULTISPECIES: 2-dehydropantoate 2-reductase [unclassified Dyella]|uniref:2-dehydropantoate 2-reductase n=1 Tax=unclassified Dyella TaxID=2634549 RepID=UPI000C837B56|nr:MULTISPECIES: 2-dehydropantoate 2-reductase [unclassified Dyella]MDR3444579.1 2-dehydropantoate 2-reductase [Dyella sp.]PMQ05637.1 2-dehydropantoate 2-reductase [Dyella sp. AD56]
MRILVIGAGATGGYFGGGLLESGGDVTFLVREKRAAQLAEHGLMIRSSLGDVTLPAPSTVQAGDLRETYDLILLSCKAYHLPQVIEDMAPAVGSSTVILPVLNGMRHLDLLDARFGKERVLGGQCVIAATLDAQGTVRHLNQSHSVTFGERDGSRSERVEGILASMSKAKFEPRLSTTILQDMWDKWVFLASLAGITCLMRAPVGDIMAASGGEQATLQLLEDCRSVAEHNGHAPSETVLARARGVLTEKGSALSASMMRDLEQGGLIEADHVVGDLLTRSKAMAAELPMLRTAYAHLKAYEARRARGK